MQRIREHLSTIALPLFALAAFASFYAAWALFDLPPKEEVIRLAKIYFDAYGLITVLVCAFLEGVLFAGWYFPGSFVIVLAVIFAGRDPVQIAAITAVVTAGLIASYIFNFFVGKYGWYKLLSYLGFEEPLNNAQRQLVKYGPRVILLSYWHPNLAALTATAAGILHMPFRTFFVYSLAATTIWDISWAIVGVALGQAALTVIGPKFVIPFIALWIVLALIYKARSQKQPAPPSQT